MISTAIASLLTRFCHGGQRTCSVTDVTLFANDEIKP
jgi:hypothetical protein